MSNKYQSGHPVPYSGPQVPSYSSSQNSSHGYVRSGHAQPSNSVHYGGQGGAQRCRVEVSFPNSEPPYSQGQRYAYGRAQGYNRNLHYGNPVVIYVGESGNEEAARNAVAQNAEHIIIEFDPAVAQRVLEAALDYITPWAVAEGINHPISRSLDGGLTVGTVITILGVAALAAVVATIYILTDAGYEGDVEFNAPWFNDQPWGLKIHWRRPPRQ